MRQVLDVSKDQERPGDPVTAIGPRARPTVRVDRPELADAVWMLAKRTIDVVLGVTVLLAVAPLLVLIAIAVRLDTSGPALFRQERYGRHRRTFTVLKFRSMHDGVSPGLHRRYIASLVAGHQEDRDGLFKLHDDPRVTRVGRLLRRTSLDELPQLINVVRGEMSLVGPRPALDYELEHYRAEHFERFGVRPGMTGLWQVSGRSKLDFTEMLDLDERYARRNGPGMDAGILLRTPVALLSRRSS